VFTRKAMQSVVFIGQADAIISGAKKCSAVGLLGGLATIVLLRSAGGTLCFRVVGGPWKWSEDLPTLPS